MSTGTYQDVLNKRNKKKGLNDDEFETQLKKAIKKGVKNYGKQGRSTESRRTGRNVSRWKKSNYDRY